jgi:micrococcal nuclease
MRQASMVLPALAVIAALVACGGNKDTPSPSKTSARPSGTQTTGGETPLYTATPEDRPTEARVTRIIDGDSIEVDIEGVAFQVRYIGIDCPEASDFFGPEATEANGQLVEGKTIRLVKDISEVDDFNRLLRYVYVGDLFVNAEMVRLGYARAVSYPPNLAHDHLLAEMERRARQTGAGLWAEQSPGQIAVDSTCCRFDAPGEDDKSREEEYVCLKNNGPNPIGLTGCTLTDEYGWSYHFGAFTLDSGAIVRIRSGCGHDTATDLYWCPQGASAIWNNDGDTVFLFSPEGDLLLKYSY